MLAMIFWLSVIAFSVISTFVLASLAIDNFDDEKLLIAIPLAILAIVMGSTSIAIPISKMIEWDHNNDCRKQREDVTKHPEHKIADMTCIQKDK